MKNDNDSLEYMAENTEPQKEAMDFESPKKSESRGIEMPQINLDFIQAKTGPGEVEEYINHVLNFNKSKSLAHIIRGATGMFGELNKGIIDIGLGILQFFQDKRKGQGTDEH